MLLHHFFVAYAEHPFHGLASGDLHFYVSGDEILSARMGNHRNKGMFFLDNRTRNIFDVEILC